MSQFTLTATQAGPGLYSGGQPKPADLRALWDRGVRRVVDLRAATEAREYDESKLAGEIGLEYLSIPVQDAGDLTWDKVTALDSLLRTAAGQPTLIHCASGNRVGALLALRAAWLQGKAPQEALRLGREAGLRGLEPAVEPLLLASRNPT